jgi:hypothetical protein
MSCAPSLLSISKSCEQNVGGIKSLQVLNFEALTTNNVASGIYSDYDGTTGYSHYPTGSHNIDLVGKTLLDGNGDPYTLPNWITSFIIQVVVSDASPSTDPQSVSISLVSVGGINGGIIVGISVALDDILTPSISDTSITISINTITNHNSLLQDNNGVVIKVLYDNTIDDWHTIEFYKNSGKFSSNENNDLTIGSTTYAQSVDVKIQGGSTNQTAIKPYLIAQPDFLIKVEDNNGQKWLLGAQNGLVGSLQNSTGMKLSDGSSMTLTFAGDQSKDALPTTI